VTRFGVVSDLHWRTGPPSTSTAWHGEGEFEHVLVRLRQALEYFAAHDVEAVLVAGDLADRGDRESIGQVLEACQEASAPVLVVAGNHDMAGDPLRLERVRETLGLSGVASARCEGIVVGVRIAGVHVGQTDRCLEARLRELPQTVAWDREPVVLLSHYPALSLSSSLSARGLRYPGDLLDRQQLADLLIVRPAPTIVVSGHLHARAASTFGPVLQLSSGAMVEPPYECSVIDIDASDDDGLAVRRECIRLAGRRPESREPVLSPAQQEWRFDGSEWTTAVGDAHHGGRAMAAAGAPIS
jgi:DNA repair exonuclease SbcCD nuclease subunit